ncbi:hypothetical protein vseg_012610 [Gypsophila vaccaria]
MATTLDRFHFSCQNDLNISEVFPTTSLNTNANANANTNTNPNLSCFAPQVFDYNVLSHDNFQQQQSFVFSNEFTNNIINNKNNNGVNSFGLSHHFSTLHYKHCHELDLYLHFQGERLKEALQQEKTQQIAVILNKYESKAMELLKHKEDEIEKSREKTRMLEEYLKKKKEEIKVYQRVGKEKEDMIGEVKKMVVMLKQNMCDFETRKDDDAESVSECEAVKNERGNKNECKWCKCKEITLVFLPCRHLCCCKQCGLQLQFCPVCHCAKQACLEILF